MSIGGGRLVVTSATPPFAICGYIDITGDVIDVSVAFDHESGGTRFAAILRGGDDLELLTLLLPKTVPESLPFTDESLNLRRRSIVGCDPTALAIAGDLVMVHDKTGQAITLNWGGSGSMVVADAAYPGALPAGAPGMTASANGTIVVSCDLEGVLVARITSSAETLMLPAVGVGHEMFLRAGVASAVAADITPDGMTIVTSGADGELAMWCWNISEKGAALKRDIGIFADAQLSGVDFDALASALAEAPTIEPPKVASTGAAEGSLAGGRVGARPKTAATPVMTLVDDLVEARKSEVSESSLAQQEALRAKIAGMRERVLAMIETNENKPELEQLAREEFQLDLAEQQRMEAEGEAAIVAAKEDIELQILAQQFLRNRIKQECWDSMEVVGSTLYAYTPSESGTLLEVSNYPMRKRSAQELAELERIRTIRKIERAEYELNQRRNARAAARNPPIIAKAADIGGNGSGGDDEGIVNDEVPLVGTEVISVSGGMHATAAEDDDESDDEWTELYSPLDLQTSHRKRAQMLLLADEIYKKKQAFNVVHQDLINDKVAETSKIISKNERITKICEELMLGGGAEKPNLFVPEVHPLETPDVLLTVADSEIEVEHVLNAEELAQQAEEQKKEEERRKLAALDNPRERGIIDMFDGKLDGKGEDEVWKEVPQPNFLADKLPHDQWTDANLTEFAAYETLVSEVNELRDKRRKALNSELAQLRAVIEESRAAFDARLQDLFSLKIETQQAIIRIEFKILRCAKAIQDDENLSARERYLLEKLGAAKARKSETSQAVNKAKDVVSVFQKEYDDMAKTDKKQDREFKTKVTKDLPGADTHLDVLVKLFRRRKKKATSIGGGTLTMLTGETLGESLAKHMNMNGEVEEEPEPELNFEVDGTEGLDEIAWDRMIVLRQAKIKSEQRLRAKARTLHVRTQYLARRSEEDDDARAEISSIIEEMAILRERRVAEANNLEVLVDMKQGAVEVQHENDFEPDLDCAVLIPRTEVEELNEKIIKLAAIKIEHMRGRMELRKGIHMLEWEHQRLDMTAEDLIRKTKDIQMLRVTRNMSLEGGPDEEVLMKKENDTLERTIKQQEALLERAINDRKRQLNKIKTKMGAIERQTDDFEVVENDCSIDVDERSTLNRVQVRNRGVGEAARRIRAIADRRNLVEVVKRQAEEISILRDELERSRMATFPAFTPGHHVAF